MRGKENKRIDPSCLYVLLQLLLVCITLDTLTLVGKVFKADESPPKMVGEMLGSEQAGKVNSIDNYG